MKKRNINHNKRGIFLDVLASLGLMIITDKLIHRLEIDSPSDSSDSSDLITQNGMSLKWNVTQNGKSLKMECHSKFNVTQNRVSLKMECH